MPGKYELPSALTTMPCAAIILHTGNGAEERVRREESEEGRCVQRVPSFSTSLVVGAVGAVAVST